TLLQECQTCVVTALSHDVSQLFPPSLNQAWAWPAWTLYEGKCYYFSTLQKTWVESQKECARLNSHLAIISNKAELVSR
uniref:C-type lectin domain-containing protein n=1 Tax=Pseudonaja textilis TaxID=8673 RepID=A0A670YTY7_PSETE